MIFSLIGFICLLTLLQEYCICAAMFGFNLHLHLHLVHLSEILPLKVKGLDELKGAHLSSRYNSLSCGLIEPSNLDHVHSKTFFNEYCVSTHQVLQLF